MAINKKLIHFKLKSSFETELAAGNILDTSIVFIKDANLIWTHGTYYCLPKDEVVVSNGIEPADGQEIWVDLSEDVESIFVGEAPTDGKQYARKNGTWVEISTDLSNYLAKNNTTAFTPTGNYNPATKKYVDDAVSSSGGGYFDLSYLIDNSGNAKTTITDEAVTAIKEAYNKKVSVAVYGGMKTYLMDMVYSEEYNTARIDLQSSSISSSSYGYVGYDFFINLTQKTVTSIPYGLEFTQSGDGTRYLSDNGSYKAVSPSYLDLNTLFPDNSGTLSTVNLQKVEDAYNNKTNLGFATNTYVPISISNIDSNYRIYYNIIYPNSESEIIFMVMAVDVTSSGAYTKTQTAQYLNSTDRDILDSLTGVNEVTTLANIPTTKRSVVARVSSATSLSVNGGISDDFPIGSELYIKVVNTSTSAITQPIPNSGVYVSMSGTSVTIPAGGNIEISIWRYGSSFTISVLEAK